MRIERQLVDQNSKFYPGDYFYKCLNTTDAAPGLVIDSIKAHQHKTIQRLIKGGDHFYSYLYTAFLIRQYQAHWQRAGYDLSYRPEIVGTLFNLGFEKSTQFVRSLIAETLASAMAKGAGLDGKTALQEFAAANGKGVPEYLVTEDGPDHDKSFKAVVALGGGVVGQGEGKSKREAEQYAARSAYEFLKAENFLKDAGTSGS